MSAKIIPLDRFRSGVHCAPGGFYFPVVYRLTGVCWKPREGLTVEQCSVPDDLVPDDNRPVTEYTLSDEPTLHITRTTFTAINRLDPVLDSGWLIVRYHRNGADADGYTDATLDLGPASGLVPVLWRTHDGIFSLCTRPPREGCPNHLLVYAARVPFLHPSPFDEGPWIEGQWSRVIRCDGSVASDDVLYPDDDAGA